MIEQEITLEHIEKFFSEVSKQLGTNGRYKLLKSGKWLDTKEDKKLTHKQFVKQLIKIARGKDERNN